MSVGWSFSRVSQEPFYSFSREWGLQGRRVENSCPRFDDLYVLPESNIYQPQRRDAASYGSWPTGSAGMAYNQSRRHHTAVLLSYPDPCKAAMAATSGFMQDSTYLVCKMRLWLIQDHGLLPGGAQAAFKPGTSTWNTDDPDQQPWLKHRKKKAKGEEEAPNIMAAGPEPLPFQSSAKLVQRQMTTGALRRPYSNKASTKNQGCMQLSSVQRQVYCCRLAGRFRPAGAVADDHEYAVTHTRMPFEYNQGLKVSVLIACSLFNCVCPSYCHCVLLLSDSEHSWTLLTDVVIAEKRLRHAIGM